MVKFIKKKGEKIMKKMTRDELIKYIVRNNGLTESYIKNVPTDILQKAHDSIQGAYTFLKAYIEVPKSVKK